MKHQDFLEVGLSPDKSTFEERLITFAQRLDFSLVSALLVINRTGGGAPLVSRVGNTPEAFLGAFQDQAASKRDPVLQRLLAASTPFTYDQSYYVEGGAADLWEEQAAFGYKVGVSVALHMPQGQHFFLGVDRDQPLPADDIELTQLMANLQLLAVFAQDTAVRVMAPPVHASDDKPHLTKRELEVLRWTRDGKSAWAVGQILAMSEHTVIFHLRNVMNKLGVSSKHQAVLKAIEFGIL